MHLNFQVCDTAFPIAVAMLPSTRVHGTVGKAHLALPLVRTIHPVAIKHCLIRPYTVLSGHARHECSYLADQQLCCHRLSIMQHHSIALHSYRQYLEAGLAGAAQDCLADSLYICMAGYCHAAAQVLQKLQSRQLWLLRGPHCCKLDKSGVEQS